MFPTTLLIWVGWNSFSLFIDSSLISETWRVLEKFYKEKKFRAIGVSNFRCDQLQDLYDKAEIKPHNLQVGNSIFQFELFGRLD